MWEKGEEGRPLLPVAGLGARPLIRLPGSPRGLFLSLDLSSTAQGLKHSVLMVARTKGW